MLTADKTITYLKLQPHPKEGGFFRETYRSDESIDGASLPARYSSPRSHSTAIYYLLTDKTISPLHRLASDEVFHFYLGDPVRMLHLTPEGAGHTLVLGPDLMAGHRVQVAVQRHAWQGSILEPGGRVALLGCTVAPGFDYADYEAANRAGLLKAYPMFADLITKLTPD